MKCTFEGCEKSAHARSFCWLHYKRAFRHGDPSAVRPHAGKPLKWLKEHVGFSGDECLTWPFATIRGYPLLPGSGGGNKIASRVMCAEVHGEPPFPGAQAAHSCGRGAKGCINPRHLSWKTPKQNNDDKILHGTKLLGERCLPRAKLTSDQVLRIKSLIMSGLRNSEIAKDYPVSPMAISMIRNGRNWGWLNV